MRCWPMVCVLQLLPTTHDHQDNPCGQGWIGPVRMDARNLAHGCCGGVRLGSQMNDPGDKLGLVRLRGLMMGVFFKGWRRKAGCVVLVMACLLATAWMRSHVTRDVFHICSRDPVLYVASVDGAILLVKNSFIGKGHIAPTQVVKDEHDYWEPWEIRWHWRSEWCGFLFGSGVKSLPLDRKSTRLNSSHT